MDVWEIELLVAQEGRATVSERRALLRDTERGVATRLRRGVHVRAQALLGLTAEDRHVLALRAWAAVSPSPPVFSHWSAAVLHGFAVPGRRLDRAHVTVDPTERRGQEAVAAHVHPLDEAEVWRVHGLLVTAPGRTVVDVAGAGTFEEGVVTADAALAAGLPRGLIEQAVDLAGPRRAHAAIGRAIGFADAGAKSAGESLSRCSMHRLDVEPPVLQHRVFDHRGFAGDLDFLFRTAKVGGEFDGRVKYLDPRYAPHGAGQVVYAEKRREDRVRSRLAGLARWGWAEARDPELLAPVLATAGVVVPRRVPRRTPW